MDTSSKKLETLGEPKKTNKNDPEEDSSGKRLETSETKEKRENKSCDAHQRQEAGNLGDAGGDEQEQPEHGHR